MYGVRLAYVHEAANTIQTQNRRHDISAGLGIASRVLAVVGLALLLGAVATAQEKDATGSGGENASNPLASTNNTDLKYKYFDLRRGDRNDFFVEGSYIVQPKLKLKYELHY